MLHWQTERHNTCIWPLNTVSDGLWTHLKKACKHYFINYISQSSILFCVLFELSRCHCYP